MLCASKYFDYLPMNLVNCSDVYKSIACSDHIKMGGGGGGGGLCIRVLVLSFFLFSWQN